MRASLDPTWHIETGGYPDGRPIVFLHGFMGAASIWRPIFDELTEGMYGLAIDLPGHGQTACELENLSFQSLADAIAAFVRERFNQPVGLCGYSMGGRIALYTALEYPDLFSDLILESCHPGIRDTEDRNARRRQDEQISRHLQSTEMTSFLTEWYQQPVFAYLPDDLKQKIIGKKSTNDPIALSHVITALSPGVQPSLWNRLASWTKPACIIAGERDDKYMDMCSAMALLVPQGEFHSILGAGHITHLEDRKAFMEVVNAFLAAYIL